VTEEADIPMTVTLHSGAKVGAGQVIVTMGRLRELSRKGLPGQVMLQALYDLCKGKKRVDVREAYVQALIGHDLLAEDGKPPESVKEVVCSAMVQSKGSRQVKLRQPYPESAENAAVLGATVQRGFKALDLESDFQAYRQDRAKAIRQSDRTQ
jgi:hypothetical protein